MEWIVITLASALAGMVDAIVGGGGLILLPALFAVFPGRHQRRCLARIKVPPFGHGGGLVAVQPPRCGALAGAVAGHCGGLCRGLCRGLERDAD